MIKEGIKMSEMVIDEREYVQYSTKKNVGVTDYPKFDINKMCKCGEEASFKIRIHNKEEFVCTTCLSELGKCIIDALK